MKCTLPKNKQPECFQLGDMKVHRLNFLLMSNQSNRLMDVICDLHERQYSVVYTRPIGGNGTYVIEYPPLPLVTRETKEEQIINAIAEHGGVRF